MARRKTAVEVLPPEEDSQPMREVKHKTEWVELRPVEEVPEEEGETFDDVEIEAKPKRKVNSEREELRKKLAKSNITPGSELKLTIEKYVHSEVIDSRGGMFAETEHCTKYVCAESHITSEDYLDVARKYGAGLYRFTLRMKNQIVTAWDKRISAGIAGPIIQQVNPADPNSPQVFVQGDGQQAVMPSIKDIMKVQREALKEQLEMAKLMREAYGFAPEQPQQQPKSEEEILASAILKQPDVIENVVGSVIKRFGGSGGKDDEPWYADVVRDAVKSGQAAQIVQVAIDRIFNGFQGLIPGRQNHGQAEMATAPLQTGAAIDSQRANDERNVVAQEVPQGNQTLQPTSGEVNRESGMLSAGQQQISPAEQALTVVIDNCARKVPPRIAADQLLKYADLLNEQAPIYSIDGYLDAFADMTVDDALAFVKSQPNGEQVVALEHARAWTEELQRLIQSQEGEE